MAWCTTETFGQDVFYLAGKPAPFLFIYWSVEKMVMTFVIE